jgi:hypothetical protein
MGQGESGGDGGLVSADADGEGVQLALIIGFHVDSQFEVLAGALGHHLRKSRHATRRSGAGSGTGRR